MPGETQFRARRTRIKILRAIAERNGVAGFSDIKGSTGLSTGSIYYHLERMPDYVTKDSKHYLITEEGLRLLRELDPAYTPRPSGKREDKARDLSDHNPKPAAGQGAEATSQDHSGRKRFIVFGGLAAVLLTMFILSAAGPFSFPGSNSLILISVAVLAFAFTYASGLRVSFLPPAGYMGLALVGISLVAAFSWFILLSDAQLIGAPQPKYENSMDALLSSYSLHWQVR